MAYGDGYAGGYAGGAAPPVLTTGNPVTMLLRRRAVRVSVINPATVAGLAAWWKADTLALSDGAAIGTWADSSGNGRDLVQATAGFKPLYKTGILNGKPVARFDGTDDRLDVVFAGLTQPNTIIAVLKLASATARWLWDGQDGTGRNGLEIGPGAGLSIYAGSAEVAITAVSPDTTGPHIITARYNGASSFGRFDGSQNNVSSPGTNQLKGFRLGGHTGSINFGAMDVGEVLIYNAAVSGTDILAIESYLRTKWGTP